MTRTIKHTQINQPGYDPTPERPLRLVARDLLQNDHLPEHQHHWGQITYASAGVIRVTVPDSTWIVPPSRAIWIPPWTRHAITMLEDAQLRALYLHEAASSTTDGLALALPAQQCRVIEVSALLRELIAAFATDATEAEPAREHLVAHLMLNEISHAETLPIGIPLPQDKRLRQLCEALIADPAADKTIEQWASQTGASARTLTRLFRSELGMSFTQWRQQMRLAQAAPLVARGYSLARVSAELGYQSQSAFTAMFRRTFGKSPSAFFKAQ